MDSFQLFLKRLFDIIGSLLGMLFLAIPFIGISILVKFSSPGPVLFKQKRIGRYGKDFLVLKFRTMYENSEALGSITTFCDPRITYIGKLLRKYKLDEFPQLWNVLIGKMSFVGPRPDIPGYADKLEGETRKILELRPGITGPASLCFRKEEEILAKQEDPLEFNNRVVWPKKVELNLYYYYHWSFWKDIGYILITVFPILDRILKLTPK
jgi:lipopolysaccharide/colanic/teichoic acid biosynthesis glycosyltransferase